MAFDKKEVYFTLDNEELVCVTDNLNNYALSNATVSEDSFKTTDKK